MEPLIALGWLLMLISGISDGGSRSLIKSSTVHQYTLVGLGTMTSLPSYMASLAIEGIPKVGIGFWYAVSFHIPIFCAIQLLTVAAHRASPLLLTVPYTGLTPVFLLIISPFMGSGRPTIWGVLGVMMIVSGLYILNIRKVVRRLWDPFTNLRKEKGSQYMMVAAFLMAIGSSLDLIALRNANPSFYLLVDHTIVSMIMMGMVGYAYVSSGYDKNLISPKTHGLVLVLFGLMNATTSLFHTIGMNLVPYVPLVIAVKRSGKIIWTVAIGLFMAYALGRRDYQSEKEDIVFRLAGTAVVIAGVLLVVFLGLGETPSL